MHTVFLVDRTTHYPVQHWYLSKIGAAIRRSLREFTTDHGLAHSIEVRVIPRGSQLPTLERFDYAITLSDTLDVADALGYHYTNPDGTPAAVVGVGAILGSPGGSWSEGVNSVSAVIDHEAKETELDRSATQYVFDGSGRAWAREACDAVQSSVYVDHEGITLSNYVLPNYFIPGAPAPYDRLGVLHAPLSLAPGGYVILADYSDERDSFGARRALDEGRGRDGTVSTHDGLEVAPDPSGRGTLVISGDLPPWARAQKAQGRSRTMRRLLEQQAQHGL